MSKKDLYKESGVDIEQGDALVDWLQSKEQQTSRGNKTGSVVDGIGGFAGLFLPNLKGYDEPMLVASTDGVGTKLLLALKEKNLKGVGIDLVAMCVNDLYCVGARPMFFVDYYATGVLDADQFKDVLSGIKAGLKQCETPLLGGETAELPGLYEKGHFDLAGFVVGLVDGKKRLGPHLAKNGDKIFAIPSNGFHSNGYSLVRKWLDGSKPSAELIRHVLQPTVIYDFMPDLVDKLGTSAIHAVANITGGGISGNLPRVLPEHLRASIRFDALPTPTWMKEFILGNTASLMDVEPVFNLGAGMLAVVAPESGDAFASFIKERAGLSVVEVGSLKQSQGDTGVEFV